MKSGNRDDEQRADRHAVASGEEEKRHEENRMRDVHIGKRGSETANDEQSDKLRKTGRFVQEASNTSSSSSTHVSLEYPANGEKQYRPEPVLVQNSGHVDDDMRNSALDVPSGSKILRSIISDLGNEKYLQNGSRFDN